MARLSKDERSSFQIYDEFVASLFDYRLSSKDIPKSGWRELRRTGYIIDRLYMLSQEGDEAAKNILRSFVDKINQQMQNLQDIEAEIRDKFSEPGDFDKGEPYTVEVHWNNQMYLALVAFIQEVDRVSCWLKAMKSQDLMPRASFKYYLHKTTGRFRSVLEFIHATAKENKYTLHPEAENDTD